MFLNNLSTLGARNLACLDVQLCLRDDLQTCIALVPDTERWSQLDGEFVLFYWNGLYMNERWSRRTDATMRELSEQKGFSSSSKNTVTPAATAPRDLRVLTCIFESFFTTPLALYGDAFFRSMSFGMCFYTTKRLSNRNSIVK